MQPTTLISLVAQRCLDPELAAVLWLLSEGGVPTVVTGSASLEARSAVATAVISSDPDRQWVVIDADAEPLSIERLSALLRGGIGLAVCATGTDLRDLLERFEDPQSGLPEDAVRRLGVVVVVEEGKQGLRLRSVHYLRPSERDAQGHVQRRPPAVLATWEPESDAYDHFAWGITPELADRVDRSQADFEDRQRNRGRFLAGTADRAALSPEDAQTLISAYLAAEPVRVPAPPPEAAKPSPFGGGLTDPDADPHLH